MAAPGRWLELASRGELVAGRGRVHHPDPTLNELVDALRTHLATQLEERVAAGPVWEENDLVFAQINGRAIERKSDWRAWKAVLDEAGVPEVEPARRAADRPTGGTPQRRCC
jgi:hypothetical protein